MPRENEEKFTYYKDWNIHFFFFLNHLSVCVMIPGYMNIEFLYNYAFYVIMLVQSSKYLDSHIMFKGELSTFKNKKTKETKPLIIYDACLR